MVGSDRVPNLKLIASEPWLDTALVQLERNGALHGVHAVVRSKKNLTPPTLSEMGIFQQLRAAGDTIQPCFHAITACSALSFCCPSVWAGLCQLSRVQIGIG